MKILIIDDHQLFVDGIEHMLASQEYSLYSVFSIRDAKQFVNENDDIDLALLDLGMPDGGGLSFLRYLQDHELLVPVLIVSASDSMADISASLSAGAAGYLPKMQAKEEFISAINTVLDGGQYIANEMSRQLELYEAKLREIKECYRIGPRQLQVIRCIQEGLANKAIGERLFISEATVKSHVFTIFKAFNVKNRVECLKVALDIGLLV